MIMETGIMLADISSVNPATLKDFVIIIIGVGGFVMVVVQFFRKPSTAITPDPLRIEKLDKLASRDFVQERHAEHARRLDAHDKEIAQIRNEAKEDRRNNEVHASQRSSNLYQKIEAVRTELNEKIDAMPERIIELLNSLGKLK